jgi:hypothetical protein
MALKKMIVAAGVAFSAQAFASSHVEDALTLNAAPAKKTEKAKSPKARVFDALNAKEDARKLELPKNARHDATAGVFI